MFRKIEIRWNFLNLIKSIFKKPIDNIILNGKKTQNFPTKSREQGKDICSHNSCSTKRGHKRHADWKERKL